MGVISLCASFSAYTMNSHDAHNIPAASDVKSSKHISKGDDNGERPSTTLTISDCWIRSLPGPTPSAGYFVVKNVGNDVEKLVSLSIPAFDLVSLHQTIDQDGKSRMIAVEEISIPAGSELKFKPGSYHAMLEKPNETLTVGTQVEARFEFLSGEIVKSQCEVKPPTTVSK